MAFKRNWENPSVPTILAWQKKYLVAASQSHASGKMSTECYRHVRKGLKYTIKALENELKDYRSKARAQKREDFEEEYRRAYEEA